MMIWSEICISRKCPTCNRYVDEPKEPRSRVKKRKARPKWGSSYEKPIRLDDDDDDEDCCDSSTDSDHDASSSLAGILRTKPVTKKRRGNASLCECNKITTAGNNEEGKAPPLKDGRAADVPKQQIEEEQSNNEKAVASPAPTSTTNTPRRNYASGSGKYCVFPGCRVKSGQGLALFGFPYGQPERFFLWTRTLGIRRDWLKLSDNCAVCQKHFNDDLISKRPNSGGRLLPNSLPNPPTKDERRLEAGLVRPYRKPRRVYDDDDYLFTSCDYQEEVPRQIDPAEFLAEKPIRNETERDSSSTAAASDAISSDSADLGVYADNAAAVFRQPQPQQVGTVVVESSQCIRDDGTRTDFPPTLSVKEEYRNGTSSGIQVIVKRESEIEAEEEVKPGRCDEWTDFDEYKSSCQTEISVKQEREET